MKLKQHIPNLLTLGNLACGFLAIIFFLEEPFNKESFKDDCGVDYLDYIEAGAILILLASVFDFLDGLTARLLKVQSEIGAQLDSLADLVTFGVAPGMMFYSISLIYFKEYHFLPYLSLLIPVFSAYRLAKFNVDNEKTDYFKGLATPANAIFWIGLGLVFNHSFKLNLYVLIGLVIGLSFLMVSNLKMFSLKIKNLKLEGENIYRLVLIGLVPLMILICHLLGNIFFSISGIILLYILLSIPYHLSKK